MLPYTLANGHSVLLVGAGNNEHGGASLAVLDAARPSGSAPAANHEYACLNCPSGRPEAFFEFPGLAVARQKEWPCVPVVEIRPWLAQGRAVDEFLVNVGQANMPIDPGQVPVRGPAWYTFDNGLHLVSATLQPEYHVTKRQMQRLNLIAPDLPEETDRDLVPVLAWDGVRLVPTYPRR